VYTDRTGPSPRSEVSLKLGIFFREIAAEAVSKDRKYTFIVAACCGVLGMLVTFFFIRNECVPQSFSHVLAVYTDRTGPSPRSEVSLKLGIFFREIAAEAVSGQKYTFIVAACCGVLGMLVTFFFIRNECVPQSFSRHSTPRR
jgi:multisubunit Na+/H+ antiporter MnhB subunit